VANRNFTSVGMSGFARDRDVMDPGSLQPVLQAHRDIAATNHDDSRLARHQLSESARQAKLPMDAHPGDWAAIEQAKLSGEFMSVPLEIHQFRVHSEAIAVIQCEDVRVAERPQHLS
jgi:hypothetical protein